MARTHQAYPPEIRQQMVELVQSEGIRGRCGARAAELIHSFHRIVHPLPRPPTPFYRRLFLTKEG